MKDIKCPCDLNQFLLGEPIFENTFPKEECEWRKFYGDCFHCFSTAIARRDHQLKNTLDKIKELVSEWQSGAKTDNLSYDCMTKIAEFVEPIEKESEDKE